MGVKSCDFRTFAGFLAIVPMLRSRVLWAKLIFTAVTASDSIGHRTYTRRTVGQSLQARRRSRRSGRSG